MGGVGVACFDFVSAVLGDKDCGGGYYYQQHQHSAHLADTVFIAVHKAAALFIILWHFKNLLSIKFLHFDAIIALYNENFNPFFYALSKMAGAIRKIAKSY